MKIKKRYIFIFIFLLIILYLLWGPLFPWSPVKIGFKTIESSHATIYIQDFNGENVVYKLDEIIAEAEKFHGIKFKEKFKIIILDKESNMKRYLPWMKGTGFSVKLGFANVIYLGSIARNSPNGIEVYLKHEISHLLIHQNTSSAENNFEILNQGWFAEGTATYYGGPYYYFKNEFLELWIANKLGFDKLYEKNPHKMDVRMNTLYYTYYRFFIEFLIESYGIEKYQIYLKKYISYPKKYKILFNEVYKNDLIEILKKFNTYMNN